MLPEFVTERLLVADGAVPASTPTVARAASLPSPNSPPDSSIIMPSSKLGDAAVLATPSTSLGGCFSPDSQDDSDHPRVEAVVCVCLRSCAPFSVIRSKPRCFFGGCVYFGQFLQQHHGFLVQQPDAWQGTCIGPVCSGHHWRLLLPGSLNVPRCLVQVHTMSRHAKISGLLHCHTKALKDLWASVWP